MRGAISKSLTRKTRKTCGSEIYDSYRKLVLKNCGRRNDMFRIGQAGPNFRRLVEAKTGFLIQVAAF